MDLSVICKLGQVIISMCTQAVPVCVKQLQPPFQEVTRNEAVGFLFQFKGCIQHVVSMFVLTNPEVTTFTICFTLNQQLRVLVVFL